MVHYNIQSLANKIDIIESELKDFDIICLTETWLDRRISDTDIELSGFKLPYRRDRQGDNHGGICVYVKDSIFSKRRPDLEMPDIECVWIEVSTRHKKLLLGTFYRPPSSSADVLASIENSVGLAYDTNISDIFVTGDFNLDMLQSASKRKIESLCQQYSLHSLITESTHFTESTSSLIDLFLTSDTQNILLSGVGVPFLEQNIRYHCPIYCVLSFDKMISPEFSRHVWLYDKGNYRSLSQEIYNTNWEPLKHNDIDIYAHNVEQQIINSSKNHIPNKIVKIRQTDPPWLTNNIKRMLRKRKRLYDKYKRTNRIDDYEIYKHYRNKATSEIRKAKKAETDKLATKLTSYKFSPKDWWKVLKSFIKPNQSCSIPPLIKDDVTFEDDIDKANILNDYFADQTSLDETHANLPPDPPDNLPHFDSVTVTPEEVELTLRSLSTGKAAGPDGINNRLLKELANPLSVPLCDLFNFSLRHGKVPVSWKEANVSPIHKKDDPSEVSNYRPISLLNTIGKVMEKIIHKHVFNFFRDHNVITTLQSGFLPGDSTINQLTDLYNTFCKALDDGKEVRAIFCDVSKAFDRVWHKGLLFKLKSVGISGSLLNWFTDYLKDRRQRVVLPGATSSWAYIKAGVPQGSILGPLLFLIYINDIVENINSSIRLFADDTSLYIIVNDPLDAAITLNIDLSRVNAWATKWLVSFNPAKSESVTFSRKVNQPYHPPIYMNYQLINEVDTHKHLGLYLSNDCKWHEHINSIKTKAWQRVNVMRRLKFILDRKSLQIIYFSFVRPLLEYADIVWDNCSQYESNQLEQIQNEAARIVTGATKLVSINSLLHETGWETLSARRKKHKLIMFYKMNNNMCPTYLSSLVPPTVGNTSRYDLRNVDNIQTIHAHSQLYFDSFLPSVVREWNALPGQIRNSTSLSSFKNQLNLNIRSPPAFYCSGSRQGQIYHVRLRTNCSSLKLHLYSKNIIDSPLCVCGEIEDTCHFLLECNIYSEFRRELLTSVSSLCNPSLNVMLYGSPDLSDDLNAQIFDFVHKYILKTKRFSLS